MTGRGAGRRGRFAEQRICGSFTNIRRSYRLGLVHINVRGGTIVLGATSLILVTVLLLSVGVSLGLMYMLYRNPQCLMKSDIMMGGGRDGQTLLSPDLGWTPRAT